MMDDKTYTTLKWICLMFLPALATLYTGLAGIWPLPYSQEIPATITAVDAFLGVLLGVSTISYEKEKKH